MNQDLNTALNTAGLGVRAAGALGLPGAGYGGSILSLARFLANPSAEGLVHSIIGNMPSIGQGVANVLGGTVPSALAGVSNGLPTAASLGGGIIGSLGSSLASGLAAGALSLFAGGGPLRFLDTNGGMTKKDRMRAAIGGQAANLFQQAIDPRTWGNEGANALNRNVFGQRAGDVLQSALNLQLGNFDLRPMDDPGRIVEPSTGAVREWTPVREMIGSRQGDPLLTLLSRKLGEMGYQGSQYQPDGTFIRREPDFDPTNPMSTSTFELLKAGGIAQPEPGSGYEGALEAMGKQDPWMQDFRRIAEVLLGPETVAQLPMSPKLEPKGRPNPSWEPISGGDGGSYHSGGIIPGKGEKMIKVLGGEAVMNRTATKMFKPMIVKMNKVGKKLGSSAIPR